MYDVCYCSLAGTRACLWCLNNGWGMNSFPTLPVTVLDKSNMDEIWDKIEKGLDKDDKQGKNENLPAINIKIKTRKIVREFDKDGKIIKETIEEGEN